MNTRIEGLKAEMSPEKRGAFERIAALRDEIGPFDFFNIVEEIRLLRGDDTPRKLLINPQDEAYFSLENLPRRVPRLHLSDMPDIEDDE